MVHSPLHIVGLLSVVSQCLFPVLHVFSAPRTVVALCVLRRSVSDNIEPGKGRLR